ncbi:phosphatase methylesterase [Trichophyton equinum CBS 127.97]|uniref:Protein phosphatase methylesterase 1 n=1 Tax=Trichophyton equinum (strain ATCC MYA-4606 / CBS 127.97) TaxID=559882 RepID=F2PZT6_TRIEC|nr:phosphatase methylesterase [Trichophyton equinum CBS 127.97]
MSDLQKTFAKSRLAKLPPEVPLFDEITESRSSPEVYNEHHEDDSSSASSASSTGTIVPSQSQKLFERGSGARSRSNFVASPWNDFFETELFIEDDIDGLHINHHVYFMSPSKSGPLFVTHHGAGSSGLSFAACAAEIRRALPTAGVLSLDARSHGLTTQGTADSQKHEPDLTLETLSRDLIYVVKKTKEKLKWDSIPPLVLVGHSLGGAVVTHVAKSGELGSNVLAYAVLDVVEGSAIDALQSMETYLSTRPSSFPSLAAGIEWHTRSRTIRNTASARVSVQGLLREEPSIDSHVAASWKWRTDLARTKPFWENWFTGLSKKFLEARGGKLLLLAGTDRLDKELIIGQMQGKYQLQVFPEAGHFIHEDQPVKTAQILVDFYKRNDRSALVLPPKVSDMLASKDSAQKWGLKK